MRFTSTTALSIATASMGVLATVDNYGQCGGVGWTRDTNCNLGWECHFYNEYFSQCIPAAISTTHSATSRLPPPTPVPTTTPVPTPTTTTPSGTACALMPRSTGPPIHALDGWAKNTWLQKSKTSNDAVLGPAISKGWFLPGNTLRLIYGSSNCDPWRYCNVLDASTSYKPLSFDSTPKTSNWGYSGPDGTLTINGTNSFIACDNGALYFQTGKDFPAGNCTTTRLTTRTDI
ncbi:hypothetical protein FRC12_016604 [Ceratobasidium sp. 428]|nr:hypothetical protein FRC12_016604 [Ceratobasidium sp. 428]